MRYHFIAIGGNVMHNLAIALHRKGDIVTGSDDELFEPSKSRLASFGLLPEREGWSADRIHPGLDAVILGMHARADNPELVRAKELNLTIYSFPEFLYAHARNKIRVVIGGSHGKTTITAMVLHVLYSCGIPCDYMIGAPVHGCEDTVHLTNDSHLMVFEGDEYLTSALDKRPKFHVYRPDLALISGIAWDHINVFPVFEDYLEQFRIFAGLVPPGGILVYNMEDEHVRAVSQSVQKGVNKVPYQMPVYRIREGVTFLVQDTVEVPLKVFGRHNLINLEGARMLCKQLGVDDGQFDRAIGTFNGAAKRLELLASDAHTSVYIDFAHAPSKLMATVEAVKEQFPERRLVACIELHTYSSLNGNFLSHYADTMVMADLPMVYYNPHAIQLKRLPEIHPEQVRTAFNHPDLKVYTDSENMMNDLIKMDWFNTNLLMMSSGDFGGMDMAALAKKIVKG
ncbi:MAG: peptidoglycan synthetase [Lentimicrobiaceae bacterium]|nr:peptidoglycan synthetase [Lentimicrobiaceae bacterium]